MEARVTEFLMRSLDEGAEGEPAGPLPSSHLQCPDQLLSGRVTALACHLSMTSASAGTGGAPAPDSNACLGSFFGEGWTTDMFWTLFQGYKSVTSCAAVTRQC